MSPSAPAPSPQEIYRKLAVHSPGTTKSMSPPSAHAHSGTESDSDSALWTPELPSTSSQPIVGSGSVNPPLSAIAEHRSGSEEGTEDEEEEDGAWKSADGRGKLDGSAEEGVIKAGYLWKKGERRKTWKKRWFVLRPAHLAYYKTSAEYKPLRLLELTEIHSCSAIDLKKHPNALGLVSPVRMFYLQASSPADAQAWIEAIERARQAALATSTQLTATTPIPIPSRSHPDARASAIEGTSPPSRHYVTSSESEDGSLYANRQMPPSPQIPPSGSSPSRFAGAKEAPKVVLAGYLMKCGSKRRNWRKRWFMLNGEKLIYSASHMDTKPHREFSFSQIVDALEFDLPQKGHTSSPHTTSPPHLSNSMDEGDDSQGAHTFKIVTTKRTLLLCAPSEEEEIKWLGAIRALIARRSGSSAPSIGVASKSANNENAPSNTATGGTIGGIKGKVVRMNISGAAQE